MSSRQKKNRARSAKKRSEASPTPDTRSPMRRAFESGEGFFYGQSLVDRCGTLDSVEALTSEVLAPDPFDWSIVEGEDRAVVEAMLTLLEPVCEQHLDSEYITVVKRLIEVAATHPEKPLRARTSPDRLAASILWIALVANVDRLVVSRNMRRAWWWCGVNSCTRLARTMATSLGFRPEHRYGEPVGWDEDEGVYLRDAAFLTSRYRTDLIAHRDRANELILEQEERDRLARPIVQRGNGEVRMRLVETDYALAVRGSMNGGKQVVVLGLGESRLDPDDVFALSIPEARRLVNGMQRAIDSNSVPVRVEQES